MDRRTADDARLGGLMRAAQAGDGDAYLALLGEITPRVRQVVWRRRGARAPEAIEDLVQDVLLSVHVARASYDPGRPFFPWLLAIVRNRLADGARRYARHALHEVQVDDLDVTFAELATNSPAEPLGDVSALRNAVQGAAAQTASRDRTAQATGIVAEGSRGRHGDERRRAQGGHAPGGGRPSPHVGAW
jgi:RNA polymerase sigma factor (sigma-70 family)